MLVNILHLTDVHFTLRSKHDQNVVFDALIRSLKRDANSPLKPDLLILSGDLVDRADEDDIYGHFLDQFLQPVLRAANLGDSRVVMTPGNHDIPRKFVETSRSDHDELWTKLTSRGPLNSAYSDGSLLDFLSQKFRGFEELRASLGGARAHQNAFASVTDFPELELSILELNSAWMGVAGVDKVSDVHHLLIAEAAIVDALAMVPKTRKLLLTTHHPHDWLADFSSTDLAATIKDRAAIHFFGHMHLPAPKFVTGVFGANYEHQGGAVYTDRKYYQGYGILQFDTERGSIAAHLRSYYDGRREFDIATDVLGEANGIFYPNDQSRAHFQAVTRFVDRTALGTWCIGELLSTVAKRYGEGITDRDVNEIFVAPPMHTEFEIKNKEDEAPQIIEKDLDFSTLVSSKENYLIYGKPEYGKTTLLRQVATALLRADLDAPTVPVVIPFASIREGTDRIEALIRAELPEMPDGCGVKQVLQEGLGTVLIDDVNFTDRGRYNVLLAFVKAYPKSRFIFSTTARGSSTLRTAVDLEAVVHFEQATIKPMRRKDVRVLVKKWDKTNSIDREVVLDRLISDIGMMSIPLTGLNTTILLSIFEGNSNFAPINKTALIERFVELLLDKASAGELERRSFDFKNKTHYLSAFASHMAMADKYILPEMDVLNFTDAYLNSMGLEQDVGALVQSMLDARILVRRSDGEYSFRYRAFLEYYIAQAMASDKEFRSWVLDESRYLSFVNEIQYYSGVDRDDVDLLDKVGSRFAAFDKRLFDSVGARPDLTQLDTFTLPQPKDDSETIIRSVEEEISAPPLTEEERDEILEGELPQDVEGRQEVFRPHPSDLGQEWLTALVVYSNVLRGTELINDNVKRGHLANVLAAWATAMHLTLWQIPKVAEKRRFVVNGVRYDVRLPPGLSDGEAARLLFMAIPNSIAELAYSSTGTEKLSKQLAHVDGEPTAVSFLRTSLRVRLNLPGWVDDAEVFLNMVRNKKFFGNIFMWKLTEHHLLRAMSEGTRTRLQGVMATALADLRGGTKSQRDDFKRKKLKNLHRGHLISKVVAKRDNQ